MNRDRPVLVFLDVEMNGVSGIDVARTLPEGTFLIFTTAYAQFALDGFELNAVDFLHKPFSYQRFGAALQKVRTLIRLKSAAETAGKAGGEITVKSEYKSVSLSVSGIRYIEAMDNYSKIYMTGGDSVLTQMSLKEMSDFRAGQSPSHAASLFRSAVLIRLISGSRSAGTADSRAGQHPANRLSSWKIRIRNIAGCRSHIP